MPSGKLARGVYAALKAEFSSKKIHAPQYEVWLSWNKKTVHITHHQTVSVASSSKGTYLTKSLIDMLVEAPTRGGLSPDIVIRSHSHQPGVLQLPIGISIGLGSWMLKSPYVWKKAPASASIIGGAILELDKRGEVHPWLIKYDLGKPSLLRPSKK